MEKVTKAAFIGLGVMGSPMAGHLMHKAGLDVTVYNRTGAKADAWVAQHGGGKAAATPALAAKDADIVCLCVGNDDDIREVVAGRDGILEGILAGIKKGAIIIDHTTASANVAREMEKVAREHGVAFLDAPVSGGQAGAENGALTVMVGGDAGAFAIIEPVMRTAYAKEIRLMGPSGSGQLTKMVNQICIAGVLQGLSEGLAFGMKANLDMEQVLAVIGNGAAQSWQMDNRGKTMIADKFDFGFAINWMIKDLDIALEEGQRNGVNLKNTAQIADIYKKLSDAGCGRMDTSALIKALS